MRRTLSIGAKWTLRFVVVISIMTSAFSAYVYHRAEQRIGVLPMPKTNLLSTVRFLSLATAALVTGPVATYAAMDPPAPKP